MFTQSADHDNEDLKQSDRQQQQQLQQDNYKELPKITQTNFASACYGCDSLSQLSSSSSNPNTCTPTTSNKSSLSSPPPPPQPSSQNLQHPQQPLQSQPSEYRNLTTSGFATSNEGGSSSLSSTASSSPPPQPPPPAPPRYDSQATHNSHLRFHPSGTSTSSAAASTAGTSIENNLDEQWQCSGQQTPPGFSSLHQSDVYRQQPQLLQSSSSAAQFAQQRHHRNRNSHPPQSQLLKWQGNDVVTAPNINRASATNVNHHIRSEPLFSNLDNTSTLVKPFQEEQLTTLQTAIRAMSWNSLRHDHLYRFRHNSYSGQDYYRHLYQQQQQRRSQSSSKHQGMEAASGGYNQDSHATKMMKLDGGSSITAPVAQPSNVSAKQQYPHSGSQLRVRSVQQIRYQHPPIRLNSKELKENYTDELVKYEDKTEGKDDQHQHLVKTISDLPIFVTIEDFRVASYTIAGEPHLCLPQLLQFLRQHFDTKTMVEKFEESLIHFPSATPKQVEGFIKSSCLPPSAKSCPLIKRSDADKICLSLFEELSNVNDKKPLSDIVSICSKQQKNRDQEIYSDNPNKSNSIEAGSNCGETAINKIDPSEKASASNQDKSDPSSSIHNDVNDINSASKTQSQENIVQQEKNTSVIVVDDSDDKYATVKKKLKCNSDESDTPKSESSSTQDASEDISSRDADKSEQIESSHDKISSSDGDVKQQDQRDEIRPSSVSSGDATTRDGLFDTEAQSSILNFARAVTSTLMIRIYHRCFGKCVGSFYPSLLKDKQMECIQCSTCKVMLTPRRFVGHTHGPKENEVCHWGFNSYNWRSYIRLSKKQQMNNLDEDELLHQFNTLTTLANELTERPPPAPIEQVPSENHGSTGRSCATTSVAQEEPSYSQNLTRTKDIDSSSSIARSDRTMHQMPGNYACDESVSQPQPASNLATSGQNTSVSMMRRFNTTDKSSSLTLHATPSSSSSSISTLSGSKVSYNPKYVSRHVSSMDNRGSIRSARSASLSGRMPSSACCSGGDMSISTSNGFTAQHPQEYHGMARTMNHYSSPSAITNTTAPGLFNQPNQLTEDLRNFLLQNWSPSTNSNPQLQHPAATQLPMLPLAPMSLPVAAGQACNPMPPMDVARPARSTNEDLTKHLSLSPESKRELYVCTNLSTYLSRRGLSAGMTGDIVEKVLNLMRESRSTL